jgi:hypothetical protein
MFIDASGSGIVGMNKASGGRRLPNSYVLVRFCLKLMVILLIGMLQVALGHPNVFFDLAWLSGGLCVALAVYNRERPFDRSLNYWDEACWFGLVSALE